MAGAELDLDGVRAAVAAASRAAAAAGLVRGTGGNLSARAGDELVAVTATGAALDDLGPDLVTVVDRDGGVVAGELAPTSELDLHLAIHERYAPGAVVHTHAPVATALSCVVDELPVVHYEMLMLGGPVRVAPYTTFGTPELAASAVEALEGRTAALLANHGTVAVGSDLDAAMRATELLEWAATVYWRAASIGTPRALDAAQRQAVVDAVAARGYGSTREA